MRTDKVLTMAEGAKMILEKLKNGEALAKFKEMMIEQGVSETVAHELCYNRNYAGVFKSKAKQSTRLEAKKSGHIKSIDALKLGFIASHLGAGRIKAGDAISYEVGFRLLKTVGDQIEAGKHQLHFHFSFLILLGDVQTVQIFLSNRRTLDPSGPQQR